jgi:hypothetical protein
MVDLADIGGEAEKQRPFAPFKKSGSADAAAGTATVSAGLQEALGNARLQEAVKGISTVDKAMKEALGGSVAGRLEDLNSRTRGVHGSLVDKQLEKAQKSIRDALGGSLVDYNNSRDHMRDVFGSRSAEDEVSKLINRSSATSEIDRYMAELERPLHHGPVLSDLPPLPPMPPNPIHETNEHLADLGQKIDALVDLQAKGAEVIDKLLQAQIANEAAQERSDKRAYRLSVINTVLATILGLVAIFVTIAVAG